MNRKPRILLYDVETSPYKGFTWGKWEQNVLHFERYRELLSMAWKYYGSKTIHCDSREGEGSDKRLAARLRHLLASADIVVGQNLVSFDNRVARARMIFHEPKKPLPKLVTVDTKRVAKANFDFPGNSQDDLLRFFGLGQKMPNRGIDMWLGCMEDDPKSWNEMRRYNRSDVHGLDLIYTHMRPWIENHPNVARIMNPHSRLLGQCPTCASTNVRKDGVRGTVSNIRQQWECCKCKRYFLTRYVAI